MTIEPALSIRYLRKVFEGEGRQGSVVALDGLSVDVPPGQFVAVVGPSGCGKSTLVDLIAGFTAPTAGTITAHGQPVQRPGPDRVVVFQDHAVFPWYTALGNVAYGLRRQGLSRRKARKQAAAALERMGLRDFAHAYPNALSGGMRQRVALARALVLRPRILLLDEPFAALDAVTRARLQDELLALWQDHGWTVIFVTHVLAEAVYLADRVIMIDRPPVGFHDDRPVDLPRPRRRRDEAVLELTESLASTMQSLSDQTELCLCAQRSAGA
jgi:NitT/TauT family transport system ATP-binding protein